MQIPYEYIFINANPKLYTCVSQVDDLTGNIVKTQYCKVNDIRMIKKIAADFDKNSFHVNFGRGLTQKPIYDKAGQKQIPAAESDFVELPFMWVKVDYLDSKTFSNTDSLRILLENTLKPFGIFPDLISRTDNTFFLYWIFDKSLPARTRKEKESLIARELYLQSMIDWILKRYTLNNITSFIDVA